MTYTCTIQTRFGPRPFVVAADGYTDIRGVRYWHNRDGRHVWCLSLDQLLSMTAADDASGLDRAPMPGEIIINS